MIAEYLVSYITSFISWGGYPAIFLLMALESMIAPVPSEAVMPFAGFLIGEGGFSWESVIFFSTLGSIAGSLVSYYVGAYGGKPAIKAVGKYFFLDMHDLEVTERFFNRYGSLTIFVARFIPVIRHLISIPAGIGRMDIYRFSFYTVIGACCWNSFLAYVGYTLKNNWEEVLRYSQLIDVIIIIALLGAMAFFIHRHKKRRK